MFRFTTRDVLWLTVVVALAVGWWLNRRDREDLLGTISDLENAAKLLRQQRELQKQERDSMVIALAEELEKALGRKLSGWSSVPDPKNPQKRILSLRYAESGTESH